jgi:two-component system NarL family sensor kinase
VLTAGAGSESRDDGVPEAISRERNRLAEALHDGALQDLAVAQQNWAEIEGEGSEALAALREDLDRLARRLRELTGGMHEDTLDELPLHQALARTLASLHHRPRLEVTLEVDPRAESPRGPFLRQTVSELVANAAQHTAATRVAVVVAVDGDALVVTVTDDGEGFDPERVATATADGHLGLARIRRAAARFGGAFTMVPALPAGTVVTVRLPVSCADGV